MTEPTAEQIEAERGRAHILLDLMRSWCEMTIDRFHNDACDHVCTAMARVRIEAHAAGRDEGLIAAEGVSSVLGRCVCSHCELAVKSIRALRDKSQ